jgi:hypothetical protein
MLGAVLAVVAALTLAGCNTGGGGPTPAAMGGSVATGP